MAAEDLIPALQTAVSSFNSTVDDKQAVIDGKVSSGATAKDNAQSALTAAKAAQDAATQSSKAALRDTLSAKANVDHQDLAALAASKAVTAVDVFVYDTSKDSDGGAWRKRCTKLSWYNEPLNTSTRGSRREFPSVAVIVASAASVVIYDGDDPNLPMWMVFTETASQSRSFLPAVATITSVCAINGVLCITSSATTQAGASGVEFCKDLLWRYDNLADRSGYGGVSIADRASADSLGVTQTVIRSRQANDVAMTVLPDAPIDPVTGLPAPTIAIATTGGISVIKGDGTVANKDWAPDSIYKIDISGTKVATSGGTSTSYWGQMVWDFETGTSYLMGSNSSGSLGLGANSPMERVLFEGSENNYVGRYWRGGQGLGIINWNNFASSLVLGRTSSYITGWMPGAIKGAFLADTDDTDLVGGELLTNGTFDTDLTGWYADPSFPPASFVWNSGAMTVTGSGASYNGVETLIPTEVGRVYKITRDITGSGYVSVDLDAPSGGWAPTGNVTYFTAQNTQTGIVAAVNGSNVATFDNISVRLVDADRSVNNNPLIVNGTITRTPVATGADLVAYGGFNASNYLEQPYNSDLDFGTGDFCVMGWVYINAIESYGPVAQRAYWDGSAYTGAYWVLDITPLEKMRFAIGNGATSAIAEEVTGGGGRRVFVCGVKDGSNVKLYINGELNKTTPTGSVGNLDNANAVLRVGMRSDGLYDPIKGNLALLRISATAPTAEQIRKIYEDERHLFQESAQATLYGTSNAVTAIAHDPDTGLLHVGTSQGRSVFKGLCRVDNTTTAVGTAISAVNGMVVEE
jgi:hypothetical protein